MRPSQDVGGQVQPPESAIPAATLSWNSNLARRGGPWWATLSLLVPLSGLLVGQAVLLLRRYGSSPALAPVDITVEPTGGEPVDAAPLEMSAFGDSAMAGVGVDQLEDSLPVQLAHRVADSTGRPVHVVGYARSGAKTVDVLTSQVPDARPDHDVSVLVVGTNDVTGLTAPVTLARSSSALLDSLEALGAPVVMSSLPEFRSMRLLPHPLMEAVIGVGALVGAVQRHAASGRPHVRYVDAVRVVGAEFVSDPSLLSGDSFHPSATGYGRIADVLAPAVVALLETAQPAMENS